MKLLVLAALIAAVASSPLSQNKSWPWQVGKEYIYEVDSYTLTQYDQSANNGNAFKAQFTIRVLAPGQLLAKLSQTLYAQVQSEKITNQADLVLPSDKYTPIKITDETFEIFVEGGRVKSFNIPSTLSVEYENLLKALISALQVDLSSYGQVDSFPNSYNDDTFQGLFKKEESDVTGECETLYNVSPLSAEWRRELPKFASEEDPIEIIKSKNYANCKNRVALDIGVPEGYVWKGIAHKNEEKQFIKHTSESRLVAGKQGTIYKSEVVSSVSVSPILFGKQKAEVYSYVKLYLSSVQDVSGAEWKKVEASRVVDSLLFAINETMFFPKFGEQNIGNALTLITELSAILESPSNLPKADFLSKFSILVRVLSALRRDELKQLTSKIEIVNSYGNVAKTNTWVIFRDALAQSGTGPAFEQIMSWILSKKIQGEEAAELISSISASLRYPIPKRITQFFDFATNPIVLEQQYLNNTALLAATRFFRFAKNDLFIVETVIPRLAKELKTAVQNGDSKKAQVYVRVLANLAHPDILKVFEPYLDGTIVVSKYLRIQIVASLKTLANLKNEYVRAALFSILRNTAEVYEVRVAAALNIFMAFPTAEMVQIMAYMANEDPSTQVQAVLTNGLTFAAKLKDPRFAELAKTAQSVADILPKEKFGYRYSTDSIIDEYTSDDEIAFFRELSYIGSEDNILPKYQRSALRNRLTGLTEENQITLSVSGVQQLLEYIAQMIFAPSTSKTDLKYSAKKIAEKLNIKRVPSEPIEGALFLENMNIQKLITFNEEDLKSFITSSIKNIEQLFKGIDIHYTKIVNNKQVYVVFPLAAGVPFIFAYDEPILYSAHGQVKIKLDKSGKALAGSLNTNIDLTYSRNIDGRIGFIDTFKDEYVLAGVINKIQFYIPANTNTIISPEETKFKFVLPELDTNFYHLSVWPYISTQAVDSLKTVLETPSTKLIVGTTKKMSADDVLGVEQGLSFQLKAYSYSYDYKENKVYDAPLLTSIGTLLYQKNIALTEFDVTYLAKKTNNKEITLSAFYDTLYNLNQGGELSPASFVEDVTANSKARREKFVQRAAAGIKSAEVQLYDLSLVFDGEKKVEYVLTAALADSFVDNKFQGIFFANAFEQTNVVFKVVKPQVVPLNFEKALKAEINVTYEVDLKFEKRENINLQGFGVRSEKYTQLLLNDPLAKQCLKETSEKNVYQKDCHKMIIKAHTPDYFKATATYKELPTCYIYLANYIFDIYKHFYSWNVKENVLDKAEDGKIEIEGQAYYYDLYADYVFKSKYGAFHLNNVEGLAYYPYALAAYAPITGWERARNWFTGYQNLPYCAVDNSKVWTFSGRSYDYSLTSSWHVVMLAESNTVGQWEDLVILARRPSDKQEEVYISYETDAGNYIELDIKPNAIEVKSNTKKVSEGALVSYWDDSEEAPLLQYYTLANGVLVFNIKDGALRLVYDGDRLVIFTGEYRSYTRGICGQSSSQTRDDYMTPYGLVDLPEYYGASFALEGEFSDPKTEELKKEAKLKAYQPVLKYTDFLHSGSQWSKAKNQSPKDL